jgi:serine/threonine protein phosphatase PrpC|tara:strand:+ start:152 stop:1240 length:1089 start_codon:yes stop_codon:yes gene_type:complete
MLLGVYDGHGRQGELVSEFASNAMVEELQSDPPSLSLSPARALKHSLFKVDERLALQHPDLAFNNGTTAVVAMLSATSVVVANVGDSRCVKASAGLGGWSALDLTADHKPDAPEERERIEALGGELDIDEELGVSRVIHANCALAMSRSIGDHNFNGVGVTAEADVTTHELSEGDTCLILASDGVWEFISSQQAVDLIYRHRHRGASAACAGKIPSTPFSPHVATPFLPYVSEIEFFFSALISEAAKRWKREEGNYRDDITAIVLFLPMEELPTAAAALTASATAAAPAVAALKSAQGVDGGSPNTVTTVHEVGGVGARESAAEDADEFAQVDGPPSRAASEADVELRMEAFRRRRLTMDQL